MQLTAQTIITILTSLGIGSLATLIIKAYLDNQRKRFENEFAHKEKRYKAIMIQMWTAINPETELKHLQQFRSDIPNKEVLFRELQLELYNGLLFASDKVLIQLKNFIENPSYQAYLHVSLAMRKDLYGKKSKLTFNDIDINKKDRSE